MQSESHPFAIGGVPATELVETHGTPLYVYDGQKIVAQLQTLQRAFTGVTLRLKYAAKALTNLSVLKLLRGAGADLDVVSIEEAQLGLLAGYGPGQILYTPSGVSFDEIVQAVDVDLVLVHQPVNVFDVVDGDAELGLNVADLDFGVAPGHDVRVEA